MRRAFDAATESIIARRYNDGETTHAIAADYDVVATTINNTLRRLGVPLRQRNPTVTDEQRQRAVNLCLGGAKIQEAADIVGISKKTVDLALRAAGASLPIGKPPSRDLNHAAFDAITPESAYWTGFLFADGRIHDDGRGSPAIVVGLGAKDRGHLEKFRDFLGSDHAITVDKKPSGFGGEGCVYFRVRSKQIAAALRRNGIVGVKAERVPTRELAESPDFWRGMIDGDGSLGMMESSGIPYAYVMLCGQLRIVETFIVFMRHRIGASLNPRPTQSGIWRAHTSGATALDVIRLLYSAPPVSMDRKQRRADAILSGEARPALYADEAVDEEVTQQENTDSETGTPGTRT